MVEKLRVVVSEYDVHWFENPVELQISDNVKLIIRRKDKTLAVFNNWSYWEIKEVEK